MNKWKSFGLAASLAAGIGILGAGVVSTANSAQSAANSASYSTVSTAAAGETSAAASADADDTDGSGSAQNAIADGTTGGGTEQISLGSTETGSDSDLTVQEVAAKAMPAMVAITNTSVQEVQNYFGGYGSFGNGQSVESVSMGTGFIIAETDDDIYIATNAHVISGASELSVAFVDDSAASATIVGEDDTDDLAVIKVSKSDVSDDTQSQIAIMTLGSSDDLQVGESVVAIGNALGYGQSVSSGIVSALNRTIETQDETTGQATETTGMIQTDASINPGNSGGALLNMKGELVGINSAKYSDESVEGMGYAIPIDYAKDILTKLANGESASSSSESDSSESDGVKLGVTCATVSEEYAESYGIPTGVYVSAVESGSAAANAGIESGDIITAVDGTSVSSTEDLKSALTKYSDGDSAEITIVRMSGNSYFGQSSAQTGTVTVTFGSTSSDSDSSSADGSIGNLPENEQRPVSSQIA